MKKKILKLVLSWILVLSLFTGYQVIGEAKTLSGDTILAFSSDVHNGTDNKSANRLAGIIDTINQKAGQIDHMGFCGDMGNAGSYGDAYWTCAKNAMDTVLETKGLTADFTTGNHEYMNGNYDTSSNSVKSYYTIDAAGHSGDRYQIYCLGSATSTNDSYTTTQADKLKEYLNNHSNGKPIIILTHFPLHYCGSSGSGWGMGSRTTANADRIIDAINEVASKDQKIVLLWGHNHTMQDPKYGVVYNPGDSLEYASGKTKTLNFYYASAGCMADTEYNSQSASIKTKALVMTIDSSYNLTFTYFDLNGNEIPATPATPSTDPEKQKFTVSFHANGHGNAPSALTVTEGEKVNKPADPSSSGWVFGGWYTEQSCQNAYNFNNAVTKSFTLYAKWTEDPEAKAMKEAREAAENSLAEAVSAEKLNKYDAEQQDIIRGYVEDYRDKISKATSPAQIESLMTEFNNKVDELPTAEEQRQKEEEQRRKEEEERQKEEEQRRQQEQQKALAKQIQTVKATAVTLKTVKPGKSKATVTWKPNKMVFSGYQLNYKKKGKKTWKTVTIKKSTSKKKVVKKLKKNKKYSFKIRGFKTIGGRMYYGKFSKTITKKIR